MKTVIISAFAALLLSASFQPAQASDIKDPTLAAMAPRCAKSDTVAALSPAYRLFVTEDQVKAQAGKITPDQFVAWMKKNNIKLVCTSQALAAGAHQVTSRPPRLPTPGGMGNANDLGGVR